MIFLTGKGDRESVVKVLALKPDGYLLKSTDKATLLKSLEDFFEKRKYEQLLPYPYSSVGESCWQMKSVRKSARYYFCH